MVICLLYKLLIVSNYTRSVGALNNNRYDGYIPKSMCYAWLYVTKPVPDLHNKSQALILFARCAIRIKTSLQMSGLNLCTPNAQPVKLE